MAVIDFPSAPTVGQEYPFNDFVYVWDGEKWTTKVVVAHDFDSLYVNIDGDTMTGPLTATNLLVSGAQGTEANAVARKDWVEAQIAAIPDAPPPYDGIRDGVITTAPTENAVFDALAGKAPTSHTHTMANITDLAPAMDAKSDVGHTHTYSEVSGVAPTVHTHAIADVTSLQAELDSKTDIGHTHTPAEAGAAPVVHAHAIDDVTGLQGELDALADMMSTTYVGETAPVGAATGSTWYCTSNGLTYMLYADADSTAWVEANPNYPIATGYIRAEDIAALPLAGGTMTGPIVGVPPTADNHLTTKAYVDSLGGSGAVSSVNGMTGAVVLDAADVGALPLAGGTLTGNVSAPDFYVTSDRRLKTKRVVITDALTKVNQIYGMTYVKNSNKEAGLIAQDLEKVLPEAVTSDDAGYLAISPSGVNALLVEAIKELTELVTANKAEISSLRQFITELVNTQK